MTAVCCCVRFLDTAGNGRHVTHSCCPTHGGRTEPSQPDQVKAAHP